jgi:hypothetical protein
MDWLQNACVPKTSSVIWLKNRVTSRGNDCAAVVPSQAVALAVQVDDGPAKRRMLRSDIS